MSLGDVIKLMQNKLVLINPKELSAGSATLTLNILGKQ